MYQAKIALGKIAKLETALKDHGGNGDTEIVAAMRELYRYIELIERKCERVEIQANRRQRFF
jgi:hypothetical protein